MAFELHVWGPLGRLPSIDPECIAAIAYLTQTIPAGGWRLIRSNDPSICPAHLLPALKHNRTWTSGFVQITHYLSAVSPHCCINPPHHHADIAAYTALLSSTIQPLVDASLYASEENWVAVTRPAYATLLPFLLSWMLPHSVRAAAVSRAERATQVPRFLALLESSDLLDEDQVDVDTGSGIGGVGAVVVQEPLTVTQSLASRFKRKTKEDDIKTRVTKQIVKQRLSDHIAGLVAPFAQILADTHAKGGKPSFFSDAPVTSLDLLAYGYFSLILDCDLRLPHPFLRDAVVRLPLVQQFVSDMHETCFPGGVMAPAAAELLPAETPLRLLSRCIDEIIRGVPTIGAEYSAEMARRYVDGVALSRRGAALAVGLFVASLAIGGGRHLCKMAQPFGAFMHVWTSVGDSQPKRSRLDGFGPIGSAVGELLKAQDHARAAGF